MLRNLAIAVILGSCVACGGGGPEELGPAPAAPSDNDESFELRSLQKWYIVGNELTEGDSSAFVEVIVPEGVTEVAMWLDGGEGVRLQRSTEGFGAEIPLQDIAAGEHQLVFAANDATEAFASFDFNYSHPLYVVVSTDWDDPDNTDQQLALQEQLHDEHPELIITHFVGPYTFTDPDMTPERMEFLANWTIGMRDSYGDEIGLHIHPYCSFVEASGLTCKSEPSTVYEEGDNTGYTVMCTAYDEEEFLILAEKADEIFVENGLGKPTSFRAGGWTAGLTTLAALARAGYVADTSANNWSRMEEWIDVRNGVLYDWNMSQWSGITDTSQPYYPNIDDIQSTEEPTLDILQVPDNGILVDYVSAEEMIEIFDMNFTGDALLEPKQYSIGYHPPNFSPLFKRRITDTLSYIDYFLISAGRGPVVYARLSDLAKVWTK